MLLLAWKSPGRSCASPWRSNLITRSQHKQGHILWWFIKEQPHCWRLTQFLHSAVFAVLNTSRWNAPILLKGNNGCTGAFSTVFPGRQQTGIPKENSRQEPWRQTLVQLVQKNSEKAFASPMWSPLLFILFQQNCKVSRVMVAHV